MFLFFFRRDECIWTNSAENAGFTWLNPRIMLFSPSIGSRVSCVLNREAVDLRI